MQAIKKINNNVALCVDSSGREVIAMGKGVGFGDFPRELKLSEIERTFYHVDESYISLLQDIPNEVLEICVYIVDMAQRMLPYAISPNVVLIMADHIQFAIERTQKNIKVKLPFAYDVRQQYPLEMEIAEEGVKLIRKKLHIVLPEDEAAGLALNIVNARIYSEEDEPVQEDNNFDKMLDIITNEAENTFHMEIDCTTFHYARFASHVYYLYQRITEKENIDTENFSLYPEMQQSFPELADCVQRISDKLEKLFGETISEEEQLYLMLHINRICTKENI